MTTVIRRELQQQAPELVCKLDELRKWQRKRRTHALAQGKGEPNVLTIEDAVELEYYGNLWHLDTDKTALRQELADGGLGLVQHQALLWHLQILASEVRGLLEYINRFEAAGVKWSTSTASW
jgi:hypothetical protein